MRGSMHRNPNERFEIINTRTNEVIQYDTEMRAHHNCEVLNLHEEKNGRPRVYAVREVQE